MENIAHYLISEIKLGLGLQEMYEPYRAREWYLDRNFPMLSETAKKRMLEDLKEEADRKGIAALSGRLSEHPEILAGAFSNLRRLQVKPSRRAILSREEPKGPREIMEEPYILEREEEDLGETTETIEGEEVNDDQRS